jgi:hypothetical protein
MRIPAQRPIAMLLLAQFTGGCQVWSAPPHGASPQEFLTTKRPPRARVITTQGDTLWFTRPQVVGDSLVEPDRIHTRWVDEPVAVARPPDVDIVPVKADTGGYQSIRLTSSTGTPMRIDHPRWTTDSIFGTTPVQREYRLAIALADVRTIQVNRTSAGHTTGLAVGVALVAAAVAVLVALENWEGPLANWGGQE